MKLVTRIDDIWQIIPNIGNAFSEQESLANAR